MTNRKFGFDSDPRLHDLKLLVLELFHFVHVFRLKLEYLTQADVNSVDCYLGIFSTSKSDYFKFKIPLIKYKKYVSF